MSNPLSHQMILANAGSGKTYCLVTRMADLLLRGAEARSLAALTFTRKAAGEFQEKLFLRLAEACLFEEKRDTLANETGLPNLDEKTCFQALGSLAREVGQLTMGTIDSLCLRIARAFPFECGLPAQLEILDEHELEKTRVEALEKILQEEASASFEQFLELVREQSHASAGREVFDALLNSADELLEKWEAMPPGKTWGDKAAIWPSSAEFFQAPELKVACEHFKEAVESTHPNLFGEAIQKLHNILEEIAALPPRSPWSTEIENFFEQKLVSQPKNNFIRITRNKDGWVELKPEVASARKDLAHALMRHEIEICLRRSRALHTFIGRVSKECAAAMERTGRLTFQQITARIAAVSDSQKWAAEVGFRLDARFNHWLLDEFQDTSRQQWKVLHPLVDEVVQDSSGGRFLFYVGDGKQAIYSWRGGDAGLFFEIFDHYNKGPSPHIKQVPLATSQRSSRVILEAINKFFGNLDALNQAFGLSEAAASQWKKAWQEHLCAERLRSLPGWFLWQSFDSKEEEAMDQAVVDLIKKWKPWERGMECACLTAKNDQAAEVAALLESHGIPISLEGKSNPCTDNPLGQSLLLALRVAATPSDSLSASLLAGFPLGSRLLENGIGTFRKQCLQSLAEKGFEATLRDWTKQLDLPHECFLARRATKFLEFAGQFDRHRTPQDGILKFVDFIETRRMVATERPGTVRIMTVHQSKGLTFDAAIVIGLDSKPSSSKTLALGPNPNAPEWGFLLPRSSVCENDSVLRGVAEDLENQKRLGEVCRDYVALTRARNATVVFTTRLGENSTAKSIAKLFQIVTNNSEKLETGDPNWFCSMASSVQTKPNAGVHIRKPLQVPRHQTPRPVRPSDAMPPGGLSSARALGQEIHRALAAMEWITEFPPGLPPDLTEEARGRLLKFFQTAQAREAFQKPDQPARAYREVPFEYLGQAGWVSGVIDRLVIYGDSSSPTSASIYEFKTGDVPGDQAEKQVANYKDFLEKCLEINSVKTFVCRV